MKTKFITILFVSTVLFSCTKKDQPSGGSTSQTPKSSQQMTATVNGISFASQVPFGLSSNSISSNVTQLFYLVAHSDIGNSSKPSFQFRIPKEKIKVGVFPLISSYGEIQSTYSENGTTYTSVIGSINITSVDTTKYLIDKFTGTFEFKTDTIAGKSFIITNGKIIY